MMVLVFSGYNQRAVVSFLRTLKKNKVDYCIVARDHQDPILTTAFVDRNFVIRKKAALDIEDIDHCIQSISGQTGATSFLIAPSTEALNRFFLDNRAFFETKSCTIPLVDRELYVLISDKYSFSRLCSSFGIRVPSEFETSDSLRYPFVAKPKQYLSYNSGKALNPWIIEDERSYERFLRQCKESDFYFQEYIFGRSFYLLYYFSSNGKVFKFSQENLIQQPGGKSIVAAVSSDFHLSDESLRYESMLLEMDFTGLIMIEIKRNEEDCFMIEANPRFWGPSQLFIDANYNLFEVFLKDCQLISDGIPQKTSSHARYFWFGGVYQTWVAGEELTYYNGNFDTLGLAIDKWHSADIYKRDDTIEIYEHELRCRKK